MFLQVALVIYFVRVLGELGKLRLLEGSKICYHQHWKLMLVLVNFQNQAIIV